MFMESNLETIGIVGASGSFQAQGHSFGVTVPAALADFCTSGDRIPGRFSPFNLGFLGHVLSKENKL